MIIKEVLQDEFVRDAEKAMRRLEELEEMALKTGKRIFLKEPLSGLYLEGKSSEDVALELGTDSEKDIELWAETAACLWPIKAEYSDEAKVLADEIQRGTKGEKTPSIHLPLEKPRRAVKESIFLSAYLEAGWRVLVLSHIGSAQEGYFLIEDPRETIHGYIQKSNEQEPTEQNIDAFLDALAKKDLYKTERFGSGFLYLVRDPKEIAIMGAEEKITITPVVEIAQPRVILDSLRSWLEERKITTEAKVENLANEIELLKKRLETLESEYASSQEERIRWEEACQKFQEFLEALTKLSA